jgi:hypothetical protein
LADTMNALVAVAVVGSVHQLTPWLGHSSKNNPTG